jgi:hypothetical protein
VGFWGFSYAKVRGMMDEAEYPYEAVDRSKCNYDSTKTVFTPKSYHHIMPLCSSCLKTRVAVQPVSVAIDGSSIQHYVSGVYNGSCSFLTNYGVLAVGYGSDGGGYLLKNQKSLRGSLG